MPQLQMILWHLRWAVPLPSLIRLPILIAAAVLSGAANGFCLEPETIGLDAMRRERPGITGIGIPVAQPEGLVGPDAWEVDPVVNSFTFFTWTSASGTASNYPNSVGVVSSHATSVGVTFYGSPSGVAPGVARVDSYDAGYFIDDHKTAGVSSESTAARLGFPVQEGNIRGTGKAAAESPTRLRHFRPTGSG